MDVQTKRYRFAGNFLIVYLLIVSLLSGIFVFSFNLYRDYISRFEVGLETGALVAELGPLIEQALRRGNDDQALRLARLLFASASVSCVDVADQTGLVLAWPPGGCSSLSGPQTQNAADERLSPYVLPSGLTLSIGLDPSYIEELDWQYTKGFTVMMVVVMAVIGLVFSALLLIFILRPLARLQQAIRSSSGAPAPDSARS